jgi:hypothetical protein
MIPHTGGADVGIVVEDLERVEEFYVSVLQLEKVADRTTAWGPMVELRFGSSIVRLMRRRARLGRRQSGSMRVRASAT